MQVQNNQIAQDILEYLITLCQVNQNLAVQWSFELDDIVNWNDNTLRRMQDDVMADLA